MKKISLLVSALMLTGATTFAQQAGNCKPIVRGVAQVDNGMEKQKLTKRCVPLVIKCEGRKVPVPTFMAYNLGADPTLNTPKKQMSYLANTGTSATATNSLWVNTNASDSRATGYSVRCVKE